MRLLYLGNLLKATRKDSCGSGGTVTISLDNSPNAPMNIIVTNSSTGEDVDSGDISSKDLSFNFTKGESFTITYAPVSAATNHQLGNSLIARTYPSMTINNNYVIYKYPLMGHKLVTGLSSMLLKEILKLNNVIH